MFHHSMTRMTISILNQADSVQMSQVCFYVNMVSAADRRTLRMFFSLTGSQIRMLCDKSLNTALSSVLTWAVLEILMALSAQTLPSSVGLTGELALPRTVLTLHPPLRGTEAEYQNSYNMKENNFSKAFEKKCFQIKMI